MGQGGYIFCELDSIEKQVPKYQQVFQQLENDLILKCNSDWHRSFGFLTPDAGQYGRTTILPALFRGFGQVAATPGVAGTNSLIHWRQTITADEHQTLLMGNRTGNAIPEDFKIGFLGLAFPNKNQHITEIKMQIGDRKLGRINLEEMRLYNKPALVFEEPFTIDEEQSFDLYGYVEGPIPEPLGGPATPCIYQRIVMLGAAYYKQIDKVLGTPGAFI